MEFNILDYTRSDALLSAKLEVELEKIGKPAGRFDTMIAAVCINRDALLGCTPHSPLLFPRWIILDKFLQLIRKTEKLLYTIFHYKNRVMHPIR